MDEEEEEEEEVKRFTIKRHLDREIERRRGVDTMGGNSRKETRENRFNSTTHRIEEY